MTRSTRSQLGESWVDGDDSDISWASNRQSASSDSDASQNKQRTKPKSRKPPNGQVQPSLKTSSTGPDLVMPSLDLRQRGSRKPTPTTMSQPRQRQTKSSTSQQSPRAKPPRPRLLDLPESSIMDTVIYYTTPFLQWTYDVLISALRILKTPISAVLAIWLFAGLATIIINLFTSSMYTAFSPICRLPGVSYLHLPICSYHSPDPSQPSLPFAANSHPPAPEFSALMSTQSQFSDILDSSTSSLHLPMDMKRSETSIRDLRQIVRYSSIPSRHELTLEFDGFIETARAASYDLQKFNSHVGRAVDIVLSTARWTERVLDDISHKSTHTLIPSFLTSLLTPFQPLPFTPSLLLDQYIIHTRIISDEIASLITEAQALLLILQSLEDRLDVIHAISLTTQQTAQISKDDILSHLWTMLGGNRQQLAKYNKQLMLLRHVGEYRKIAFAHVSATILKLQAMGAELEELRTRVGAAELQKDIGQDVPLEVHIESIRMGVARLEEGREKAREVERGHVRRVLDDADTGKLGRVFERKMLDG